MTAPPRRVFRSTPATALRMCGSGSWRARGKGSTSHTAALKA
ncbi:hypothetical protein EYF80_065365 [Liparis tanakae]|uniref:Uncharacterized protein n=1 Tax=Liparis tanakae TaxID=230148 RepID=A0A4Z2E6W7_9TELE|nr:hypothetical protein EYF80_065365 [Liparis tanakae]